MRKSDRQPLFDGFGNRLAIKSLGDFATKLRGINWHAPVDETRREEKHAILGLLWTRARNELLEYPFRLVEEENDPPDFTLEVGGHTHGIEVTQITTGKHRQAFGHIRKNQPKGETWVVAGESEVLRPNEAPTGDGYGGGEAERQFCELVGSRVREKCGKQYAKDVMARFTSHLKNELLLYERYPLGISLCPDTVPLAPLKQAVIDQITHPFSSVSIVKGSVPAGWVLLETEGPQTLLDYEDPSSPGLV